MYPFSLCTTWPRTEWLSEHTLLSQSLWLRSLDVHQLGPLLRVSQAQGQAVFSSRGLVGKAASESTQGVGRIQFPVVVGLGTQLLADCWLKAFLSPQGPPVAPRATHNSLACGRSQCGCLLHETSFLESLLAGGSLAQYNRGIGETALPLCHILLAHKPGSRELIS